MGYTVSKTDRIPFCDKWYLFLQKKELRNIYLLSNSDTTNISVHKLCVDRLSPHFWTTNNVFLLGTVGEQNHQRPSPRQFILRSVSLEDIGMHPHC